MVLNVTIPLVEQLRGDSYELTKAATDDEESKTEKEKEAEKGKESLVFSHFSLVSLDILDLEKFKRASFPKNDHPVSELYASLPELPPEA